MSRLAAHHCPGCGTALAANPRYPWHFCPACLNRACDAEGAELEFANAGISGGLLWRRRGGETWRDATGVLCLILGRPALVREARFGGVVAEPMLADPVPSRGGRAARPTDLT